MTPKIKDGDYLIICSWFRLLMLVKGATYEIDHSGYGRIIKIFDGWDNGFCWFYGLSKHSVSKAQIGGLAKSDVRGMVVFVIKSKAKKKRNVNYFLIY